MIRNEVFDHLGNCISAEVLDPETRTVNYEEHGQIVLSREMTIEEWEKTCHYPPLDTAGALATLLVVEGILPLINAANAVRKEPEHLIVEAEAWGLG